MQHEQYQNVFTSMRVFGKQMYDKFSIKRFPNFKNELSVTTSRKQSTLAVFAFILSTKCDTWTILKHMTVGNSR